MSVIRWTALALIAPACFTLAAQNTSIKGVVKNGAGEPVAGALVKVRSEYRGLGFMVVSQEKGRFSTPNLLPGKYAVQAFGGNTQSVPGEPIEVSKGRERSVNLVLNAPLRIPPRPKQMTDADYQKLMPEGGVAKTYVAGKCTSCHSLEWTVSARKSREKWLATIDRMYDDLQGHQLPLLLALFEGEPVQGEAGTPDRVQSLGAVETVMLDYLAKYFGPDIPVDPRVAEQLPPYSGGPSHPNRNLPAALLQGVAAKYFAMEFSLPSGSMPQSITVDSRGIAWVGERNTGTLGRFDPNTLTYERTALPPGKNPILQVNAVAVDPQDRVWFADDGPNARILQYDPKSREFNSYPIPEYPFPVPDTGGSRIATLRFSNGNVWATRMAAERILKLDPRTRKINEYPVPKGSVPFGLAVGENNMLWYAAAVGNSVVRLELATGKLTPHGLPIPRANPKGMALDAEGNLWVAAIESGKLLKMDHTGHFTEYTPPTEDPGPFAVDIDTTRNLVWFSEMLSDRIVRFDPRSKTFVEFPQLTADADVERIEIDRSHPNRVWWSGGRANKIGYIEVLE